MDLTVSLVTGYAEAGDYFYLVNNNIIFNLIRYIRNKL